MLLITMGCLSVESFETRIQFHGEDEPATVTLIYHDISSAEANLENVQGDFESLIGDWQGDEYLLDRAKEGFVVKDRALAIEDGKLVAYEKGVTKDLGVLRPIKVSNGERIMLVERDDDYELVESNGKIIKTDNNTLLVWPEDQYELYLKHRAKKTGESHEKNRQIMIKLFEEYMAKQKSDRTSKP
jgi:hypothetical protein